MQEWRLITTGYKSGALNMAMDEAILTISAEGDTPPTLRFYGWTPACLSLGYAQKAADVDWGRCRTAQVDVVRRQTGGRAILHDQEVTYSIVAPDNNPCVSGTILESYLKISQGLRIGFHRLGIDAEIVSHKDLDRLGTAACFDSPSFYELTVGGRKVVGSAQTRKNGFLLQHGSIIRALDEDLLFDVLAFPNEEVKRRVKQAFKRKACSLQEVLGRAMSDEEIIEAMVKGFTEAFDVKLIKGELSIAEVELAQELVLTKYTTDEWNRRS